VIEHKAEKQRHSPQSNKISLSFEKAVEGLLAVKREDG
jgi:hypothetical protein